MPIIKNLSDNTGAIKFIGATSVSNGYLLCDGSTVAQLTYPGLFSVIGTIYNTGGEPGGTFRLPDLRSKSPMGVGQDNNHSLTNRTLAQFLGTEVATVSNTQLPSHYHKATTATQSATHTHGTTIGTQNVNTGGGDLDSHTHNYSYTAFNNSDADNGDGGKLSPRGNTPVSTTATNVDHSHTYTSGGPSAQHNHTFTTNTGTGSGSSHNNIQPSLVGAFFIRY